MAEPRVAPDVDLAEAVIRLQLAVAALDRKVHRAAGMVALMDPVDRYGNNNLWLVELRSALADADAMLTTARMLVASDARPLSRCACEHPAVCAATECDLDARADLDPNMRGDR